MTARKWISHGLHFYIYFLHHVQHKVNDIRRSATPFTWCNRIWVVSRFLNLHEPFKAIRYSFAGQTIQHSLNYLLCAKIIQRRQEWVATNTSPGNVRESNVHSFTCAGMLEWRWNWYQNSCWFAWIFRIELSNKMTLSKLFVSRVCRAASSTMGSSIRKLFTCKRSFLSDSRLNGPPLSIIFLKGCSFFNMSLRLLIK